MTYTEITLDVVAKSYAISHTSLKLVTVNLSASLVSEAEWLRHCSELCSL